MSGKKVLVISSSPRRRGNSDQLADAFIEGAQEAGHIVEKISLHDKQIGFCKGCLGCQKTQHCILRDDMDDILPRMQQAEVIAFASPVYFYSLCGQLKTLLHQSAVRRGLCFPRHLFAGQCCRYGRKDHGRPQESHGRLGGLL